MGSVFTPTHHDRAQVRKAAGLVQGPNTTEIDQDAISLSALVHSAVKKTKERTGNKKKKERFKVKELVEIRGSVKRGC